MAVIASSPERQIEIDRLCKSLETLSIGQTVTYADLSSACGRNVQTEANFSLMAARRRVEERDGVRLETIRSVGIRRLDTEGIVGIGSAVRLRIRRAAKRGYQRLTGIRHNDITPEIQVRIDAERSLLGAISSLSSDTARKASSEASQTGPATIQQIVAGMK